MSVSRQQFIRLFVSDPTLEECREHLVKILASHTDKDLGLIEAVLMKELLALGIDAVRNAPKIEEAKE